MDRRLYVGAILFGAAIGAIAGLYLSCTGWFSVRDALMAFIAGVALFLVASVIRRGTSHG
jgi:F0F1-type ATP synthase assembly protein I